jgi:phage baseplate assembly protein W
VHDRHFSARLPDSQMLFERQEREIEITSLIELQNLLTQHENRIQLGGQTYRINIARQPSVNLQCHYSEDDSKVINEKRSNVISISKMRLQMQEKDAAL